MKNFVYEWPNGQKPAFRVDDGYLIEPSTGHIIYYVAVDRTIREFPGGEIRFWIRDDFLYDRPDGDVPTYFFSD